MALTPDELRKRIPQWSLESDGQLLQYMNQISKNLEAKCKQTQDNFNRLLLELDESHIRFANASNSFNGIQQLKYVENRVQDDDESFYSVREEEEEKGEKLPYGEIFHMAVEKSIANMYKSFEKVTVQLDSDSDSDDDEEEAAVRNTVLRAVQKYPYISRPLPHIIGSREWREKWHAGLIDSEEESDVEPKEQYSDSSDSEGMFPSQTNSNHTPSESEGSVWGVHSDPRLRAPSIDRSVSGDDALSIHSSSSAIRPPATAARSLLHNSHHKVPVLAGFRPPSLFPDQPPPDDTMSVSSRNKVANLFEESDEEESTPTHRPMGTSTTNSQPTYFRGNPVERKTVNLFADEPPPSSHEPTPTSSMSSHSQKKPVNLFIDSDEDDSFNNNSSSKSSSVYQSEPPELPVAVRKSSNLFDDDDDDNADVTPKANHFTAGKAVSNAFDKVNNNQAEEDDDLFVPAKRSINGGAVDGAKGVKRVTNLFDDEPPEEDFDQIFKPKATDRKVPGGKLVLPPIPVVGKQNEIRRSEREDSGAKMQSDPQQRKVEPVSVLSEPIAKKKVNLFDDDDDESSDIFSVRVTKKETPQAVAPTKPKINLFDDDDDEDSPLVGSVLSEDHRNVNSITEVKPKGPIISQNSSIRTDILKKQSIFDSDSNDDEEDDLLFGGKRPIPSLVPKKEPEPLPRKVEPVTTPTLPQSSPEVLNNKLPPVKSEIFDELSDNEKQKSKSQTVEPQEFNHTSIRSEILKKKSIFDSDSGEDEDEDDLLFGVKSIASAVVTKTEDQPQIETITEERQNDASIETSYEENTAKVEQETVNDIVKVAEKPQIPDEPPEDDGWEDPPPDDHEPSYPEVSNDIDYYLTTNRINEPLESSISTSLVQSNHVNSIIESMSDTKTSANVDVASLQNMKGDSKHIAVEPPSDDTSSQTLKLVDNGDPAKSTTILPDLQNNDIHLNDSSSNKSALNFNSIGLFDDIPPPDDCFEESRTALPAIDHADDGFYSARSPAASSSSIAGTSANTNHYLFLDDGDGPPPDDEVDDGKVVSKIAEPAPFKSISAIIEERNKNESSYEGNREKPKINRLSAKVNINVNALLPGARRPSPAAAVVEKTADILEAPDVVIPADPVAEGSASSNLPESPKSQPDHETGSAKLVSLNKGRAKIQNKRKPQSRQTRRSNYENSLASGTTEDFSHHPPTEDIPKEEVRVVVGSEGRTQHVEVIAAHVKVDQLLSNELIQKLSQLKPFEDNVDEDDEFFKDATRNSTSATIISSNTPAPKSSKPSVAAEPVVKPLIAQQPPSKPTPSAKTLFSDEESDDSDLFGKISKPPAMQNSTAVIPKRDTQPNKPAPATLSHTKKQSIFGDSDEDDDLFSKPQSSAKPLVKPVGKLNSNEPEKPIGKATNNKSIFGSDEDSDGDDLFGGSKKGAVISGGKVASKKEPKMTSSKPVPARSSKSLFGEEDDDDDDDLFSSKSKSASKPTSSQPVTTTKKLGRNPTTLSAKTTADDPLADLLK